MKYKVTIEAVLNAQSLEAVTKAIMDRASKRVSQFEGGKRVSVYAPELRVTRIDTKEAK